MDRGNSDGGSRHRAAGAIRQIEGHIALGTGENSQPILRIVERPRSPITSHNPDAMLHDVIAPRREGVRFPRVRYELDLSGPPHIPIVMRSQSCPVQVTEQEAQAVPDVDAPPRHTFRVGDRVKVLLSVEALRQMQIVHGGWKETLAEHIGRVGVISRFTDRGDARVLYGTAGGIQRFTVNPDALTKVDAIEVGDVVRVNPDAARVKQWQQPHRGWGPYMMSALGNLGTVVGIYPGGDVRVRVGNCSWRLNPLCVRVTNHSSAGDAVVPSHPSAAASAALAAAAARRAAACKRQ